MSADNFFFVLNIYSKQNLKQKGYFLLKVSLLENPIMVFVSFIFTTLTCKCTEAEQESTHVAAFRGFLKYLLEGM